MTRRRKDSTPPVRRCINCGEPAGAEGCPECEPALVPELDDEDVIASFPRKGEAWPRSFGR